MAMELLVFAAMFVCEAKVGQITLVFCDLLQFCLLEDVSKMGGRKNMRLAFMVFNLNILQINRLCVILFTSHLFYFMGFQVFVFLRLF
jgi:hypothetical protein